MLHTLKRFSRKSALRLNDRLGYARARASTNGRVLGDISGVQTEIGDRPGGDVPLRRRGPSIPPGADNQQGGLHGDSGGLEPGQVGGQNGRDGDHKAPQGRNLDEGGQPSSVEAGRPRQTGGSDRRILVATTTRNGDIRLQAINHLRNLGIAIDPAQVRLQSPPQ